MDELCRHITGTTCPLNELKNNETNSLLRLKRLVLGRMIPIDKGDGTTAGNNVVEGNQRWKIPFEGGMSK
jgi:hypothetical protein